MPQTFATDEPLMSAAMRVTGICGEIIDTSAYANMVMLDVADGSDQIDIHLSLPAARALVQNLNAAIIAASLLASGEVVREGEGLPRRP
jgi:hypothetical protein